MSRVREEQDRLTVIILEQLEKENLRHDELLKRTLTRCGSRSKFRVIIQYLTQKSFIEKSGRKGSRAPYKITEKGKIQLSLLKNNPSF